MIETETEARTYAEAMCDSVQMSALDELARTLTAENARQNLVSPRSLDSLWRRHIVDSLQLVRFFRDGTASEGLDLGSGAGFPGIVLAIVRPNVNWRLVEPRTLRSAWLERTGAHLGLSNLQVFPQKIEHCKLRPADVITARAFAPLDRLLRLAAPFSTEDTLWVLPKGASAEQEMRSLPPNVREMFHVEQSLTDPEAGIVIGRGKPRMLP